MLQDVIVPGGTQRELMVVISDTDSEQCKIYEFSVTSFNDIAESEAAVIVEIFPIGEAALTISTTIHMQGIW